MKPYKTIVFFFVFLAAALVITNSGAAGTHPVPVEVAKAADVQKSYPVYVDNSMTAENEMALINQQRQADSLQPLSENSKLDASACDKLNDMVTNQYWAHVSPSGVQPWHWFAQEGYDYKSAGENLAYGQTDAQNLITAWMNSPEHKANILDDKYKEQGMCIEQVQFLGHLVWLSVSHFGVQ